MQHRGGTLTGKQRRAIEALLSCATVTAAAQSAGMSRVTLYRWLHGCPEFVQALRAAEADAVDQAARRLAAAGGGAVETLIRLADTGANEGTQRAAAADILAHLLKLRELTGIEARLRALEERHNAND